MILEKFVSDDRFDEYITAKDGEFAFAVWAICMVALWTDYITGSQVGVIALGYALLNDLQFRIYKRRVEDD